MEQGIPYPCFVPGCNGVAFAPEPFKPTKPEETEQQDTRLQWFTARSKHPGGVNALRCDGSVNFYSDSIDQFVWRALTSAAGGETLGAAP